MKRLAYIITAAIVFSLNACTTQNNTAGKPGSQIPVGDNSMNSLEWQGVYVGTLPCADCEGMLTTIILNEDMTFTTRTRYLGKSDDVFESSGTFTWNDEGNKITLNDPDEDKKPVMYLVGENMLYQLDLTGEKIEGETAGNYILKKPDNLITGKYWKLIELNGKEIVSTSYTKEPHFIFNEDGTFNGAGACNRYSGSFTLREENRITISEAAVTEMACGEFELESQMLEMLNSVTKYKIEGEELRLFDEKNELLGRFVRGNIE